jgi:hypothetical protein
MKLNHGMVPLSFVILSGVACTPSDHRGPAANQPNDSAPDSSPQVSSGADDIERGADSAPLADTPRSPGGSAARAVGALTQRPVVVPRPTGPYRVQVVDGSARALPVFHHEGRSYVLGTVGDRYEIVLSNPTSQRVEAVVSIDGLDAIDGTAADYVHKRGYILPAYGGATIEGFRTSLDQVATFRFSSVADSYAGRLGQARDVGVIGVAFFPERAPVAVAPMPARRYEDWGGQATSGAPTRSAPAPKAAQAPPAASPPSEVGTSAVTEESSNAAPSSRDRVDQQRKGLGTEFGEARDSHVAETEFARANATSPSEVVAFRYNDRAGLISLGIRVDPPVVADTELRTRETAEPFRANRFATPPP